MPNKLLSRLKNDIKKIGPNFFVVDALSLRRCPQNPSQTFDRQVFWEDR